MRVWDEDWGEVEFRFDLPIGASDEELDEAERGIGLPLPAPFKVLLRRWNGPRLFGIWDDELGRIEEIRFFSTAFLAEVRRNAVRELDDDGTRLAVVIANGHGCDIFMEPEREEVLIQDECRGGYFLLCPSLGDFLEIILKDGPTKTPSWADRSSWTSI